MGRVGLKVLGVLALLVLAALAGLGFGAILAAREDPQSPPSVTGTTSTAQPGEDGPAEEETAAAEPGTITAEASAARAAARERVTLSGTYTGAEPGTVLQVQRNEGGEWADFPVRTSTGEGGQFSVDVALGRPGPNELRLVDPETGTTSEPVTITVE